MKQNIARDWLANFVIGFLVNWAPCELLDNNGGSKLRKHETC